MTDKIVTEVFICMKYLQHLLKTAVVSKKFITVV